MKRTLIRYKTKPETTEENQRLIENVFRELQTKSVEGFRYVVLKLSVRNVYGDLSKVTILRHDRAHGKSPCVGPTICSGGFRRRCRQDRRTQCCRR